MNELVDRLRCAYRRELDLYGEVERLGEAGVGVAREGRPLAELNDINSQKQRFLRKIAENELDAWLRSVPPSCDRPGRRVHRIWSVTSSTGSCRTFACASRGFSSSRRSPSVGS